MRDLPTGLEIRFEQEMASAVPGWQSEVAAQNPPVAPEPRPVRVRKSIRERLQELRMARLREFRK
ncbi:MAG TPA: hypothetical protein VIM61_11965 [Chthoniobacterales bacterium]|jgi:hypothetical protein